MKTIKSICKQCNFTLLVAMLIILNSSNFVHAQWIQQTSGTSNYLWSVNYPITNIPTIAYAVGENGVILKTGNSSSWSFQTSGTAQTLTSVYFGNFTTGCAVGVNGTIVSTSNGGSNWSVQSSGTTWTLYSVHFVPGYTTVFAVGMNGTILKSTNSGVTWTSQNSGTTQVLRSVYFTSLLTGYVVGANGTILKTTNGGNNWTIQTSGTAYDINSVCFLGAGSTTGYAVGNFGTILKTTNGGASWTPQTSGTNTTLASLFCIDANTVYVVGLAGTILKTTNGGASWSSQVSGTSNYLYSVYFADDITGYIVGSGGTILHTTNGGEYCTSPYATVDDVSGPSPLTIVCEVSGGSGGNILYKWYSGTLCSGTVLGTNSTLQVTTSGWYACKAYIDGFEGSCYDCANGYATITQPPPVSNFSGNPTSGAVPLSVQFADLSTGNPTSWSWNFGDGGTSTQQNPSHTYNSAGSYTVSLTVSNQYGSDTETKTNYITVGIPPISNFSGNPTSGAVPLSVQFTDLSTGNPTSFSWTFGDGGTSTQQNPSHTYNIAGSYTVSLTVTNQYGSDTETKANYITVGTPPVANFSGDPIIGAGPLLVHFTNLSTGNPTSFSWTFGDGGMSTQQNPSHTYLNSGAYTVSLIVTNQYGSDTETKVNYITVGILPDANFSGNPTIGSSPLSVQFTDLSIGNPTSFFWTFGDGGTSTQQNPSHTYNSPGTYTVSLTISNQFGSNTETRTDYIIVTQPGPAPDANFTGNPTSGSVPLTVVFSDQTTNNPTSWSWNFGDGDTSSFQNPQHNFSSVGYYTVTLFVTNQYGNDTEIKENYIHVTQIELPVVITSAVSNIATTSATSGGNVTNQGSTTVTVRGVCWNTDQNPTISDSHTTDGVGIGEFVSNLTGLAPNTTYFVRAYATNSAGTSYGNEVNFTTMPSPGFVCGDMVNYQGTDYSTVQIGTQCWFKENLKVGTMINGDDEQTNNQIIEKYCYNNLETNCELYGGLYQWDETMQYLTTPGIQGICPLGWHIPTDEEWTTITNYSGGENIAGGKLKSIRTVPDPHPRWESPNTGAVDEYAFSVLPSGNLKASDRTFFNQGSYAFLWSSTEYNASYAWHRVLAFNSISVNRTYYSVLHDSKKENGHSVRCINDETPSSQLNVNPIEQQVTSEAGTTTFNVISNTVWTVTESVSWLTVSPMNGNNSESLTVTFSANNSIFSRIGQITVTAEGGTPAVIVTVSQEGKTPFLNLSISLQNLNPEQGNFTFDISSNINWEISNDCTWLSCSPLNGSNNQTIAVEYQANNANEQRTCDIIVEGIGISVTLEVNQAGLGPFLLVEPFEITLNAGVGSSGHLEISSNVNWTINGYPSWLDLSAMNGSNNANVTITANSSNTYGYDRSAILTISGNDVNNVEINVTQLSDVGIDEKTEGKFFRIWPNPTDDLLFIKSLCNQNLQITIFNQIGEILRRQTVENINNVVNLSFLQPGLYYFKVSCEDKSEIQKLIIN